MFNKVLRLYNTYECGFYTKSSLIVAVVEVLRIPNKLKQRISDNLWLHLVEEGRI